MTSNKALLLGGVRTPIGGHGRSLSDVPVEQLVEHVARHALRDAGVQPYEIDGFFLGHAFQSGLTPNTANFVWRNAGFPPIPAFTIQNQCGSGMKAVNLAMDAIALGQGDLYLAGGAESMSTVPYLVSGIGRFNGARVRVARALSKVPVLSKLAGSVIAPKFGPRVHVGLIQDGMAPLHLLKDTKTVAMPQTAQRLADNFLISRRQSDEYALRSQELAAWAIASGRFQREIVPVLTRRGSFAVDEHPRKTSLEQLAALPPVSKTRDLTAGNSSGVNDGACALVVASQRKAELLGVEPLAVLADHVLVGLDHEQMGLGPVLAIRKLLERNRLSLADIDLFEVNEAFAPQYLACEMLLGLDRNRVNVNGGAIALGHPIAMSGARVILTLAHELKRRGLKRGIAALCIGGGMGVATLIESQ